MLQPPSPGSFVRFSLICSRGGGGSTAAAVTLDTVANESRKKMADGVARSPSRLRSRDGQICCYGDALSTTFLRLCLASYFAFFVFRFSSLFFPYIPVCISSSCPFVCSAAFCYSQLVFILYAGVIRVLSACLICTLPHPGILLFLYSSSFLFFS